MLSPCPMPRMPAAGRTWAYRGILGRYRAPSAWGAGAHPALRGAHGARAPGAQGAPKRTPYGGYGIPDSGDSHGMIWLNHAVLAHIPLLGGVDGRATAVIVRAG